jgi:hypothetical protein
MNTKKYKIINIIIMVIIMIIILFGVGQYYNMQQTVNKLSSDLNNTKLNIDLNNQANQSNKLESDIDYSIYIDSANKLNQALVDYENNLADVNYKKTLANSAKEEESYITEYLNLSKNIKDLFIDDNSKFLAATSFYLGAMDKAKFTWDYTKSYDFNTKTIPVILLCYSHATDNKELVSYAMMDYSIKDDKFMNLKIFNTYYGNQYLLGTGDIVDSEASQGGLTPDERARLNRGGDVNNILDYVNQWHLDHPNGVSNPDLDAAVKLKLKWNGLE